jgi:BED zinc finger
MDMDMDIDFSDAALENSTPLLTPAGSTPAGSTPTSPTLAAHPVDDVAVPATTSGRACGSPVWGHFKKAQNYRDSHKAECMHCSKILVASHGSTSTMLLHLQKNHPNDLAAKSPER